MAQLASARAVVEQMVREGRSFREVEDYVERVTLADEQKAALWLLAWAAQDRGSQRRLAIETLALVSG
jgi:hypothetical protein